MAVKKYYSTKNGKKVQVGWSVGFKWHTKSFGKFAMKDKWKAEKLNAEIIEKKEKGHYDNGVPLEHSFKDTLIAYHAYLERSGKPSALTVAETLKNFWKLSDTVLNVEANEIGRKEFHSIIAALAEAIPDRSHYQSEISCARAALNRYGETETNDYRPVIAKATISEFGKRPDKALIVSLDPDEVKDSLAKMYARHGLLKFGALVTQFIFGDRIGEVRGYHLHDINFDKGLIYKCGQVPTPASNRNVKSKVYRLKEMRGVLLNHGNCPRMNIKNLYLMAFYKDLIEEAKLYAKKDRERFLFCRKNGDPISYWSYRKHLEGLGHFGEKNIKTHKVRKSAKTLGELVAKGCNIADTTKELLRHSNESVEKLYRDKNLQSEISDLPARLFIDFVLPVYEPTQTSLAFAYAKLNKGDKTRGIKQQKHSELIGIIE